MAAIVVPFRGTEGKQRLERLPDGARRALAHAMLADVLAACTAVAPTTLVSDDLAAHELAWMLDVATVPDPPGGQGPAVTAALTRVDSDPALVVNADLPCVQPRDLLALLGAVPDGGAAIVPAADGTTNALAFASRGLFAPLYGRESARRFRKHVEDLGAPASVTLIPNLVDDVDTLDDLERLEERLGSRTRTAYDALVSAAPTL